MDVDGICFHYKVYRNKLCLKNLFPQNCLHIITLLVKVPVKYTHGKKFVAIPKNSKIPLGNY